MQKISFVYRRKAAVENYCDKMRLRGGIAAGLYPASETENMLKHVLVDWLADPQCAYGS
jgi:hypothetical protein